MFGNDIFTRVKRSENKKMAEIAQFLHENDLSVDTTVEVFITVTRDEKLIACGGIAGNIIKCVAISESVRGEGLALTLATELINLAYERHSTHLFIYTKTEYEALFRQCGFSTLTSVPGVMVLMENSATRLKRYAESLKKFRHPGNKIGCIVMNANPFTNGHRYLIQQAAAQCDWLHLFLVKEDSSRFPYEDRLDLVLKGTADIPRLTVHRGSEYIISRATFPCYFIKEQSVINHCYTEIDLKIFRQYLAPADVMIRIAPLDTQDIDLQINSSVEKQFGDAIRTTILEVLARYNVRGVQLNVDDKGALDCILRARLEALLARASGIPALPWEDCQ